MSEFQFIETNGIKLRVAVKGEGPLVLLIHGFPESWYSWRHQIDALAAAGFKVAAPDVRGYGGSDRPHAIEDYSMEQITADFAGLAKALSPDGTAVIVGHDWGAPLAWNTARLYPDIFRAVAGLSVPYQPPGEVVFIDVMRKLFTERDLFFYQIYFQDEGVAEKELEADTAETIRKFYYSNSGDAPIGSWPNDKKHGDTLLHRLPEPDMPLPWLSEEDVAYYAKEFATSGFRGPLNRYRNWHRDHAYLKAHPTNPIIQQPSLFIGGTKDLVIKMMPKPVDQILASTLADVKGIHMLDGIGHWTQQEAPEEVSRLLLQWLSDL